MKFIEEMKERPEEERMALSAMIAGAVALLLFVLWGITFFNGGTSTVHVEVDDQAASAASFEDISKDFTNTVNEFGTQYEEIRRAMEAGEFVNEEIGTNAVEISVDESGQVEVQNVIVGPTQE